MSENEYNDDERNESEDDEEINATAAFGNNVITNITNKSNKKAFRELTFSKGDDFIVESSSTNNFTNLDNSNKRTQTKVVSFENNEKQKPQLVKYNNPNYNEIAGVMEDQLLISKSMIFNNLKENIIQPINIGVSIGNDIKRNDNLVGNDINVQSEMSSQKMNSVLSRPKRNNINKDFGDIWITPLSLQKTLSNDNNTYNSNSETNLNFLSQQQPRINYSDINVSQSLQMINKELDMLTGRINNKIPCTHNYNKEHNFGCNYYDASPFLRKSNDQYKQFSYDSLDKNKFFDYSHIKPPPRLRYLLTSNNTTNQRYNDYYTIPNSNNTNYSLNSARNSHKSNTPKINSRVLYNLSNSSRSNIFI